ncbi:unnamed protein product [Cylicostephanus goldi]|uniref:Uncharacterized protein n=1 Tax=Cylicostephanus goldi TaxID=71465 RepID=A0A3P6S8A3_CYLGO|nr:unnamed protein product [Cylicostephanus goldi]
MLKLKDMRAKHLGEMRELSHGWTSSIWHEWYEILGLSEIHRKSILMYLDALGQHVTMKPTRPADRGYPLPSRLSQLYEERRG